MTAFGCDLSDRSSCGHNPFPAAERFGFRVKLMNLGQDYIDMVQNPKYGHGKNMNPCVDCRIMMLSQAKAYMEMVGADFIITGEVMGQRPFSQVKGRLALTEQQAGVRGLLLRPLSAKLLLPSTPEQLGWVDRERLKDFQGRSRKPQIELAAELGLHDYPNPASGCLLTDPGYSARLRDLFDHQEFVDVSDLNLLRLGRQFRLTESCKAFVGRDEADNDRIEANVKVGDTLLEVRDAGSPITLLRGAPTEQDTRRAAEITARYSDKRHDALVRVTVTAASRDEVVLVRPMPPSVCQTLLIGDTAAASVAGHAAE